MYKLVVLDLDGTLLNDEKEISKYTSNVLKQIKNNTKIVLASARGFWSIKPYLEKLHLLDKENYTISYNGSLIVNNLEQSIVDEEIEENYKKILVDYIKNYNNMEWLVYTYNERIKSKDIDNIEIFMNKNKIYKVVCRADEKTIKTVKNSLPKFIFDLFEITSSTVNRIEFVKKGMTKVNAISKLLDILKIEQNEVIAIGNGENDIEMIKFAGCGIAMKNAPFSVKSSADIITDTNNDDGVGKILFELFK